MAIVSRPRPAFDRLAFPTRQGRLAPTSSLCHPPQAVFDLFSWTADSLVIVANRAWCHPVEERHNNLSDADYSKYRDTLDLLSRSKQCLTAKVPRTSEKSLDGVSHQRSTLFQDQSRVSTEAYRTWRDNEVNIRHHGLLVKTGTTATVLLLPGHPSPSRGTWYLHDDENTGDSCMVIDWPEWRSLRDAMFPANATIGRTNITKEELGNPPRTPRESRSKIQREGCGGYPTPKRCTRIPEGACRTISMASNAMYVAVTTPIVAQKPVVSSILSGPAGV